MMADVLKRIRGFLSAWHRRLRSLFFRLEGHRASMYAPDGTFVGGTRGDIWAEVTNAACWLVDNNVPWEEAARREPAHHFVLGRTMAMESDSLRAVLGRLKKRPLPNVYTLEIHEVRGVHVLVIDQLGDTLQNKFKKIPPIERITATDWESMNSTSIRNDKRKMVRWFERIPSQILLAELLRRKEEAHRNYIVAGEVSLAVYSLHLREMRRRPAHDRVAKFEENHPNVFGDAELIQEALFLGVGIFSSDVHDVIRMARMLRIPARTDYPIQDRHGVTYRVESEIALGWTFYVWHGDRVVAEMLCKMQSPVLSIGNLEIYDRVPVHETSFDRFRRKLRGRPPLVASYRGRGLGTALLRLVERLAKPAGFNCLDGWISNVDYDPDPGLPDWYRRRGFTVGMEKGEIVRQVATIRKDL